MQGRSIRTPLSSECEVVLRFTVLNVSVAESLPLPQDVPIHFRVLPEFVLEDVIDYLLFIVR
jgi:hypothetical protein